MSDLFKLYKKLKLITAEESELILNNDFENLKEKLAKKNELIDQIDQLNQKQYFVELAFSHDEKELKAKKNDLYQLLQDINKLQLQNIKALENKKEENKEKMISLYSREKSIKGYLNSDKYEAKFFDEKS
jgi:hypothetical protein